ncbi:TraR/DksA family transcriptional regulator [Streptomyces sp. 8N706]|uniref:TraR/DksA family transcriptional regulator n=1 Tax=Streptomyces sp. 8N706 TaxID=3457416 RepID=UPI003FD365CF
MNDPDVGENTLRPEDLHGVTAELTRQATRLRQEIAAADEEESLLRGDCDLDAADAGTKTVSVEQLRTRTREARTLLQQTDAALSRLREGTFGVCTDCGRSLGRARALAMPHTALCIDCRRRSEAGG